MFGDLRETNVWGFEEGDECLRFRGCRNVCRFEEEEPCLGTQGGREMSGDSRRDRNVWGFEEGDECLGL